MQGCTLELPHDGATSEFTVSAGCDGVGESPPSAAVRFTAKLPTPSKSGVGAQEQPQLSGNERSILLARDKVDRALRKNDFTTAWIAADEVRALEKEAGRSSMGPKLSSKVRAAEDEATAVEEAKALEKERKKAAAERAAANKAEERRAAELERVAANKAQERRAAERLAEETAATERVVVERLAQETVATKEVVAEQAAEAAAKRARVVEKARALEWEQQQQCESLERKHSEKSAREQEQQQQQAVRQQQMREQEQHQQQALRQQQVREQQQQQQQALRQQQVREQEQQQKQALRQQQVREQEQQQQQALRQQQVERMQRGVEHPSVTAQLELARSRATEASLSHTVSTLEVGELFAATRGFDVALKVGEGGFGDVFMSTGPLPSLPGSGCVAIKRLSPDGTQASVCITSRDSSCS